MVEGYGWLNTIYRLAKVGVFTKGTKHNAIESVEETNLREVLTYLSWESADAEYTMEYQKEYQRRMKNKNGN